MNGPNQSTHGTESTQRLHSPLVKPGPVPVPDSGEQGHLGRGFVASIDRHLLFEELRTDELARLDSVSSITICHQGETIYQAGAPASHIYVNLEGAIYLLLACRPTDEPPVLSEVLVGEIFGVCSVVGNRRYTTDAVAAQRCRVLSIEAKTFLQQLRKNPLAGMCFAQGVARVYMDRYLDLMRHL